MNSFLKIDTREITCFEQDSLQMLLEWAQEQ